MPANAPFLAKFAMTPAKGESGSKSDNQSPEKGTLITRVRRETTDDR